MQTTCSPMFSPCSELGIFIVIQLNNLLSYCGLVDARISTSEKDLPVQVYQTFMMLEKGGSNTTAKKSFCTSKLAVITQGLLFSSVLISRNPVTY